MDFDKHTGVEIWGGTEYSVVRVRGSVYDQLACSGHEDRTEDLELFGDLGIKTIRYPLLWEKYSGHEAEFFKLHDDRLQKLGELGIKPIASLLHHGSGPFFTDLYDKNFPELLAGFALTIAQRYPWIEYYTPVNEPLTTARFSGLYGFWYPHLKDDRSFARIFVNELKGIVLSMKAIRSINPDAKLIQTEDLGRTFSSNTLKYQADFDNLRRWLTCDFLLGMVNNEHPLKDYFTENGIGEHDFDFFLDNDVIPYICGYNYYVTSERYLDHRKQFYPECFHGGNNIHEYADVELVRANIPEQISSYELLKTAWERHGLPLALTEVHLACTREEQLRWFREAWDTANLLKKEGIDFRAITAWSFFGSFDWSSLLCQKNNIYEPGVYDIRSGLPRPTALAALIKSLNAGDHSRTPILEIPGWWRRSDRMIFKSDHEGLNLTHNTADDYRHVSPVLITGAKGSLGEALARVCRARGIVYHLSGRNEMDIASEESVSRLLEELRPWAVINAAGFTRIDEAEKAAYTCFRENTIGPGILAEACRSAGIKFVTFSTDQVFNGSKKSPYKEDDSTNPLNLYGLSKKFAEEKILKINSGALIIRSSTFFNPWSRKDHLASILKSGLLSDQHYYLPSDIIISPSYIPALVNTVLDLMLDDESGIYHLSSQEEISYFDFVRMALNVAGLNETIITPVPARRLMLNALRPPYSVLHSSSGIMLPLLGASLNSYLDELRKESSPELITHSSYTEVL